MMRHVTIGPPFTSNPPIIFFQWPFRHDRDAHVAKLLFVMAKILNLSFFVGMFDKKLLLLKLENFT